MKMELWLGQRGCSSKKIDSNYLTHFLSNYDAQFDFNQKVK